MSPNLFKDWRCPKCQGSGPFYVTATAATPDGISEEYNAPGFEDDCACVCGGCSHSATVADFLPALITERDGTRH
ncbi:MAG: hypothetical protein K6F46_07220 [Desulfovibrio sp.]|nr:hypothetical protein [Desulfovibrio sp.]